MSQSILSERVLQSYFSFVFWGHQMQAKTSYHKAITITVITVFQRAFYTEGRIVNSFNYRYNIITCANSTSKCKITKCFCKSTPLVLRNSISFLVSH